MMLNKMLLDDFKIVTLRRLIRLLKRKESNEILAK